jgi:hypothetical protein
MNSDVEEDERAPVKSLLLLKCSDVYVNVLVGKSKRISWISLVPLYFDMFGKPQLQGDRHGLVTEMTCHMCIA